jgi:hypothetical protein
VNWNPQRNLMEAQQYDRLLETNPAFRMARIRKECGPITDPQLRADCIASFDQYEPLVASTEGRLVDKARSSPNPQGRLVDSADALPKSLRMVRTSLDHL